jgi:glutamate racemase
MSSVGAPILVFDSGVGGLSVLTPLREALPSAPIVYAADNAGFPYGSKSESEIAARVPALLGRLTERYRPLIIVIACNTASTIALEHVRAALDVPVVGTVPAIKPAAEITRTKVIGLLGTPATVRQAYVDRLATDFAADCTILRHGAGGLAAAAEARLRGEAVDPMEFESAMQGLLSQPGGERMDVVVLACTHFPLVEAELSEAAGRSLTFIDGSQGIARRTAYLLGHRTWPQDRAEDIAVFTRADAEAGTLAPALARHGLTTIQYL